jgi:hypothetical protein
MKTYTVIGLCEEQRHAYVVEAETSDQAEEKAKEEHRESSESYRFVVAGVVEGKVKLVDTNDKGWDRSQ